MSASDANPFAEGGRTKYKALVRHAQQQIWSGLGKDPESGPDDERVKAMAKLLEINKLAPNRPDRRFPNVNQLNYCWTAMNEYQLCVEKRAKNDLVCQQRARDYSTVCPQKWIDDWKDQTERGVSMSIGKEFIH